MKEKGDNEDEGHSIEYVTSRGKAKIISTVLHKMGMTGGVSARRGDPVHLIDPATFNERPETYRLGKGRKQITIPVVPDGSGRITEFWNRVDNPPGPRRGNKQG